MNGKIRDGIMLRMAGLSKTNRKMTARLPVQNAIGRPSASKIASDPNSRTVSHAMSISSPIAEAPPARDQDDVLEQLREALQHHQESTKRQHQLDRPVLDSPLGE